MVTCFYEPDMRPEETRLKEVVLFFVKYPKIARAFWWAYHHKYYNHELSMIEAQIKGQKKR